VPSSWQMLATRIVADGGLHQIGEKPQDCVLLASEGDGFELLPSIFGEDRRSPCPSAPAAVADEGYFRSKRAPETERQGWVGGIALFFFLPQVLTNNIAFG